MISDDVPSRICPSTSLPPGVLRCDYLKFRQLSVEAELLAIRNEGCDDALEEALGAILCGAMRKVRPAMKVFFDGCQFWVASHWHRYLAARRFDAIHQEFWCAIEPGSRRTAMQYARRNPGFGN